MPLSINSNIASLTARRNLNSASDELAAVSERLASGLRINRASDDPAGLIVAEDLSADARVFNQGVRNLNDGISVLQVADNALAELENITVRIQELAEQSSSGALSPTQRASLDSEAQALSSEFTRIVQSTTFNNTQLLVGEYGELSLQVGYGENGNLSSDFGGAVGDGTFSGAQTFFGGNFPFSIQLGDINGDGNVDLVTGNAFSNDVTSLLGNGNGTFASAVSFSGFTTICESLYSIAMKPENSFSSDPFGP